MTSRVVTAGLRSRLGLQNPALIFFRSEHEICAVRVPSAPVSMLFSPPGGCAALPRGMGSNDEAERLTVNKDPPKRRSLGRGYHISCQTFVVPQSGLIKLCMQLITSCLRKGLAPGFWGPRTGPVVRK